MPITKAEAISADEFHHVSESQGGRNPVCYRVRRNGRTQTWKTRPDEFRIPVKWGIGYYLQITHSDAQSWNAAVNGACMRCVPGAEQWAGHIRNAKIEFLPGTGKTSALDEVNRRIHGGTSG